ncbi:MAG: aminotransferase class III-fold pyridoxal phosphate-dependent enzyme, partial [Gammaproteobacteria bacterium]|nr:aminotransferase class III-fold pyridoxal phosphate-dependent enzyme [Gammaproteobacteria bacterium]
SLARLWMDCGIQPEVLAGHSIGEFVAACLAGVMTLDDGIKMIVERAGLMQSMPSGKMLSVRASASNIEAWLSHNVQLAAVNSPNLCVLSGPEDQIEKTKKQLETKDFACSILHTSHAFHSSMMDPVVKPFRKICQAIEFNKPQIPIISTVTGVLLTEEQAIDPEYWATHLRNTVRFSEAINTIWQQQNMLLLEVGPRTTCTTLAKQHIKDRAKQLAVASLKDNAVSGAETTAFLMAAGQLWLNGSKLIWPKFYSTKPGRIPLPTYSFERKRYWLDKRTFNESTIIESPLLVNPSQSITQSSKQTTMPNSDTQDRKNKIISDIKTVLEDTSGITFQDGDENLSFLDLGLDSLILTQASLALKNQFKVEITFRQLLENYPSIDDLSIYLDEVLPDDQYAQPAVLPVQDITAYTATQIPQQAAALNTSNLSGISVAQQLISQQLQFLSQQLASLNLSGDVSVPMQSLQSPATPESGNKEKALTNINKQPVMDSSSRMVRIQKSSTENLNQKQKDSLQKFIKQYNDKTAKSKEFAQQHRKQLSDPRTVSGFKPLLKEMVYPIVTDKASGSRLWDIDGNEYIDITCGFGVNYFGWSPDFVTQAVTKQLEKGIEVGPQTPLAGIVAEKICRMTGNERVAFCNTGSEAVLAAIRMARTVSGRNTMVMFSGAYHGIFDEVVVRGSDSLRSFPAAPGIPQAMVENMMVLEYGTDETLEIIRSKADEIAGVLVETVQSRRPDLQPVEFLKELRKITEASETALIFDEVVTGFRVHQGGAQAYFDIRADIATYGKVIGGGLPIGVVAGKARYLDVLDGGQWQFGDDSIPEVGVTFFAGTFVRQPLGLAAANAVLDHLEQQGPQLQQDMSDKVEKFVTTINQFFEQQQAGFKLTYFTSFFYLSYSPENTHGGLLFYYLRELGIHIWESRPCFFTTQHSEQDIKAVELAFKGSIMQMQRDGFIPLPD